MLDCRIVLGDAFDVLAGIGDGTVSLVCTDPPYHRVKGEAWDRQWKTDGDYLDWIGRLCAEWRRVLAPNGSLYVFASPRMAARVECVIGGCFEVLNHVVWRKTDANADRRHVAQIVDKGLERSWMTSSERIIFAEQKGSDGYARGESEWTAKYDELRGFVFEPLRAYLDGERRRAGVRKEDCNAACGFSPTPGGMASRHYFGRSQWQLPTAEHYAALRGLFNRDGGDFLARDHESLREQYESLREQYESLRRPFSVSAEVPYTDVWDFPTVPARPGKHPCEKPLAMAEHIIRSSSRPGDLVLDSFVGSGVTAEACLNLGRRFVGSESSPKYHAQALRRIGRTALPLHAA